MRLLRTEVLFDHVSGEVRPAWMDIAAAEVAAAVATVEWPPSSGSFTLNPTRKANGVVPIKKGFQLALASEGWSMEHTMSLGAGISPGPIDAVRQFPEGLFAVEWETGNISSSHRSLNRMALGILSGRLIGGLLVLPSRAMYEFLTDRIGNFREIAPYFPIWKALQIIPPRGYLAVVEVEFDRLDATVPLISKGTDGRALL